LIARVESKDKWFAVSKSELVSGFKGHVRHTDLTDVMGVVSKPTQLLEVKRFGGPLELRLADDSTLTLWLDGGRPFLGVLNVFNYIVKMNQGRRSGQGLVTTRARGSIRET